MFVCLEIPGGEYVPGYTRTRTRTRTRTHTCASQYRVGMMCTDIHVYVQFVYVCLAIPFGEYVPGYARHVHILVRVPRNTLWRVCARAWHSSGRTSCTLVLLFQGLHKSVRRCAMIGSISAAQGADMCPYMCVIKC